MYTRRGFSIVWPVFLALCSRAAQIPLRVSPAVSVPVSETWDLQTPPNVNATGNLVFATASSFLQHWPNTRYRNGHSLVPATVPPGTLLYHGRSVNELPSKPDWVATDPEHSMLFCRTSRDKPDEGCWHLTLVTSRPLQVLYFDGSGAAKMPDGAMDSQDVVAWGKVIPEIYGHEKQRIEDLCVWGKKFGLDGFVRMEMDFEIMLCDFTAGLEVASFLNLANPSRSPGPPRPGPPPGSPGEQHPPPPPPPDSNRTFFQQSLPATFGNNEELIAGHWHNRYPGDTRIQLDYSRLISFYDTALVPSLVSARMGQDRLKHRLLEISSDDAGKVMRTLEKAVEAKSSTSGVDWRTLLRVIGDRYGDRLEMLQHLLNITESDSTETALPEQAKRTHSILRVMLRPYILASAVPTTDASNDSWASPVFKLCATTHTSYISSSPAISVKLTASEHLLLGAVQETNREICRTIVRMWVGGVAAGLDEYLKPAEQSSKAVDSRDLMKTWAKDVSELMGWLDWSVWLKCRPACAFEDICYLPTWPYFRSPNRPRPGPGNPPVQDDEADESADPQPRCIPRGGSPRPQ